MAEVKRLFVAALAAFVLAAPAAGATTLDRELLREVNRVRAVHERAPLLRDPVLERAARSHSTDMVHGDYFAHGNFTARMRRFGARWPLLGENLAWGSGPYATARALVGLWLESPPHRANLLRRAFGRIGIAAVASRFQGVEAAVVVTADFAGPSAVPRSRPVAAPPARARARHALRALPI
jgi:uncharacterized protein YkwD